eukprot:snap_masked-scaffold_3-processed-gene-10.11-mRNA-1 protein AED:1.00 eAED:1.00 QI:0/-1/0/0/-1/1/1/0/74
MHKIIGFVHQKSKPACEFKSLSGREIVQHPNLRSRNAYFLNLAADLEMFIFLLSSCELLRLWFLEQIPREDYSY